MKDPVTIKVDRSTRDTLRTLGSKGESYDDVVLRLIRHAIAWEMDREDREVAE